MANYYPIKCPYCLKLHTNATVRFNLTNATVIAERAAKRVIESYVEAEADSGGSDIESGNEWDDGTADAQFIEGNADWDTDTDDSGFSGGGFSGGSADPVASDRRPAYSTGARRKDLPTSGYFTFSELKEIFGMDNVRADLKTVLALPALTNEEYLGELLVGVTVTVVEGEKEIEKLMRRRYCDCADDRKLSESAGSIPSYVILLMGSSDSGKTVFLSSLYHELSRRSMFNFPPSPDPEKAIARLWLSVLSEGTEETDIETITDDLFDDGILPFSTFSMTNEPLTMEVTIKFNRTGLINKALLFLRDVPGEFFTNRDRQEELVRITSQFPKFDGFMITFDPLTFDEAVFPSEDREKDRLQRKQVSQFRQVVIRSIAPTMPNNMIVQPTAAIITKGDMFFNRYYINILKNMGISYAMPLLTTSQMQSFDKPYFDEVDFGARRILGCLSGNISELIGAHFSNAFFSMVSALSRNPVDMYIGDDGRRRVSTPAAISPWHVTDPMLRLLMRLHIIPPLDETVARSLVGEPHDERMARTFRNRNVINEWGAKYCTGGSAVNLI